MPEENKQIASLKALFADKPELWKILDLDSYESERMISHLRESGDLFSEPINLYMTGRTTSGKTTIGNLLLDQNQLGMKSTGHMDCTDYLGVLATPSLVYYDTPGSGSDDGYENINRAIFLMSQREE